MTETRKDSRADEALAEVTQLVQSGNLERARELCEQVLARSPQDADALLWLGQVAMRQFRWDEAIAVYDRLLRLRVDPWTLGNLGVCHWKVGRLGEAEYCLRGALELKPDFVHAHVSLANVLHGLRRFDAALGALAAAENLDADDHQIPMRRGCSLTALGRYDEAQRAFARSIEIAGRFSYPRLIAFDRATYDAISIADQVASPPQPVLETGVREGGFRYVVLISCNPAYVRKYGFPFMRSFAARGRGDNLLHLHIYDPDDGIFDEVRRLVQEAGLPRVAVTTEASPFPESAARQRKAYYACGRLVHLPHWLELYRCPLLVLDVDFIVEGALDALVDTAAGHDVGLNRRDPPDSPWLDIIANIIVANPTPAAHRYFAAVRNYALHYVRRETDAWLVDQSALFCTLKMMERFATPPSVAWFAPDRQAALWHIGHAYDHLLNDPRYRQYAAAPDA